MQSIGSFASNRPAAQTNAAVDKAQGRIWPKSSNHQPMRKNFKTLAINRLDAAEITAPARPAALERGLATLAAFALLLLTGQVRAKADCSSVITVTTLGSSGA